MRKQTSLLAGCVLSLAVATVTSARADDMVTYEVTVTNAMHGQPLAPIMVATHKAGIVFFEVGGPTNDELAWLSEAGNGHPMAAKLLITPGVTDAQVGAGLTFPGNSATIQVKANEKDHLSFGAMIGKTNDAFAGLADVALPRGRHTLTYTAIGYDAGAESNDESAATIGACGGVGYSGTVTGEGFVHIHPGVHGGGCLDPAIDDWRNPVAVITVKRVSN